MAKQARSRWQTNVVIRLVVAVLVGLVVVVLLGFTAGWTYAPAVGWIAAACVYLGWTWIIVLPMDADQTRDHVGPEDPPRGWVTDVIILSASVASLAGVAHLLAAGSKAGFEKNVAAAVGVVGIVAAWCVVHTIFSVRYADVYYSNKPAGSTSMGTENPRFMDFFYLGFIIGMTYQVSDTNLETRTTPWHRLCQALLAYSLRGRDSGRHDQSGCRTE